MEAFDYNRTNTNPYGQGSTQGQIEKAKQTFNSNMLEIENVLATKRIDILQEKGLVYLAVPYSHTNPFIREERFETVNKVAGILMSKGVVLFSPISHTHPISLAHSLPTDWTYWKRYDQIMLNNCSCLAVLMLDGWKESVGVAGEIEIAKDIGIPVIYLDEEDILRLDVPNKH